MTAMGQSSGLVIRTRNLGLKITSMLGRFKQNLPFTHANMTIDKAMARD
jgi:hypothetical protein